MAKKTDVAPAKKLGDKVDLEKIKKLVKLFNVNYDFLLNDEIDMD